MTKIYHHTSSLLVHYLVKWTRMYWPTLLVWFCNKDVTSRTECNRYGQNQHCQFKSCIEVSSFSMDTCSMPSSSLVNSLIKNRLFKYEPDIDEPPFQFIHTTDLSVVDMLLHDSPDLVIHITEIWVVLRPQVGCKKVPCFLTQQLNCCTCAARCAGALSCWNIKSLPDTLHIAGSSVTSLWRRKASSKKSLRDITRISYFVTTMKLLHALQIFQQFLWRSEYAVRFSR